jgi:hypothetical protein
MKSTVPVSGTSRQGNERTRGIHALRKNQAEPTKGSEIGSLLSNSEKTLHVASVKYPANPQEASR